MTTGGFALKLDDQNIPNYPWARASSHSTDSVGTPDDSQSLFTPKGKPCSLNGQGFGAKPPLYHMWYDDRLESYVHWPKCHPMKPETLAGAGFYYTGYSDKVRCFWCNITLHQWEVYDCALEQHKKHSKGNCNFLKIYFPSKSI